MAKVNNYTLTAPCNNCPYRKDAPLQHWSIEEFERLKASEQEMMGTVYGCHKNNGHTCIGWLMNQDENNIPSIRLRIDLSKHNVTREYLDSLKYEIPRYNTINEMCAANFKELSV